MKKQPTEIIQDDKIFALIAYLSILCIIPLVLKKDSKFVLFHAKQGLVLFIAEVIIFLLSVIPGLGPFVWNLGILVAGFSSIFGIVQALMGKRARIYIISKIADNIIL